MQSSIASSTQHASVVDDRSQVLTCTNLIDWVWWSISTCRCRTSTNHDWIDAIITQSASSPSINQLNRQQRVQLNIDHHYATSFNQVRSWGSTNQHNSVRLIDQHNGSVDPASTNIYSTQWVLNQHLYDRWSSSIDSSEFRSTNQLISWTPNLQVEPQTNPKLYQVSSIKYRFRTCTVDYLHVIVVCEFRSAIESS